MKFLLLASFALACAASSVPRTGSIAVGDDGSYVITSPLGRQVTIRGPNVIAGRRYFQVTVSGPDVPARTVQVSESSAGQRGTSLAEIVRQFQGTVNDTQYQSFLNEVSAVSPQVYQFLQNLDQQVNQQNVQQYYGPYAQYRYGYQYPSYGTSLYFNPLLQRIFGSNQQYNVVPQSGFYGYQQYPYGQYYQQYSTVPQYVQQLNQIKEVEEAVQQAVDYQQQQQGLQNFASQQYSTLPYYLRQILGRYGSNYPYYYSYYNQQPNYGSYSYGQPLVGQYYQNTFSQPQLVY